MKNYIGFMIRKKRLEKNLSQEGLCKGICVVSYLSKIEQGLVNPSDDIIKALFAELEITYNDTSEQNSLYVTMKEKIVAYLEHIFFEEGCDEEYEELLSYDLLLESSPYYITWMMCKCYQELSHIEVFDSDTTSQITKRIKEIESYTDYMEREELFLFYTLKGNLRCLPSKDRLLSLQNAKNVMTCSNIELYLQRIYFEIGNYTECIQLGEHAYSLASEEGNVTVMLASSFILAICFSTQNELSGMMRYYKRTLNLARKTQPDIIYHIYYNIGASYVEHGSYADALTYLLKTIDHLTGDDLLLAYHKQAICYQELHQPDTAADALKKANQLISATTRPIYKKMIHIVELRMHPDYMEHKEYEDLLLSIYQTAATELGFGFKRFHGSYLIELYSNQRKYKDALHIMKEINYPFSQK